ncbi:MAG TPA: hypothetical protein PK771_13480 [Spirochaetota bacterium]|nr:hypothetical protein [Spirochaetota bacterium]
MLAKSKIAIIHIYKNILGLSDGEYRKNYLGLFGVDTSKHLSDSQFKGLKDIFETNIRYRNLMSINQYFAIMRLKNKVKDFDTFCSKNLKKDVTHINNITREEASKLIYILQKIK